MEKPNYSRRYFTMIFGVILSAYFLTLALFVTIGSEKNAKDAFLNRQGPLIIILAMLACLAIFSYIGIKIYDSYLGPRLRRMGWNEASFFRGLGLSMLTMIVLDTTGIALVVLVYKLSHF